MTTRSQTQTHPSKGLELNCPPRITSTVFSTLACMWWSRSRVQLHAHAAVVCAVPTFNDILSQPAVVVRTRCTRRPAPPRSPPRRKRQLAQHLWPRYLIEVGAPRGYIQAPTSAPRSPTPQHAKLSATSAPCPPAHACAPCNIRFPTYFSKWSRILIAEGCMHRVFVGCKGTVTLFSDQLNSPWRSEGAHMDATDSIGDFCLRLNESDQRRVQVHERLGQAACLHCLHQLLQIQRSERNQGREIGDERPNHQEIPP